MDYETRVKQAEANLASVYKPQTDFYNKQVSSLPGVYDLQRNQLDQARVNAFRQIEQTANSRGMFFSGQPIQKQLEYNFGTFDPTMARINSEQQTKKSQLEQALLTLNLNKNKQARTWVDAQIKAEQEAAAREQARQDAERRHQEQMRLSYARLNSSRSGSVSPKAALNDFLGYISKQFDRQGGAGNTSISRQTQDSWANYWMDAMGVQGAQNRQFYWDAFNNAYNRNNNPYADPRYTKSPKYYSGTMKNNPRY